MREHIFCLSLGLPTQAVICSRNSELGCSQWIDTFEVKSYVAWMLPSSVNLDKYFSLFFCFIFNVFERFFWGWGLLSSPGWHWSHDPPASASQVWDNRCVPPTVVLLPWIIPILYDALYSKHICPSLHRVDVQQMVTTNYYSTALSFLVSFQLQEFLHDESDVGPFYFYQDCCFSPNLADFLLNCSGESTYIS
jgi:hypothetical protein